MDRPLLLGLRGSGFNKRWCMKMEAMLLLIRPVHVIEQIKGLSKKSRVKGTQDYCIPTVCWVLCWPFQKHHCRINISCLQTDWVWPHWYINIFNYQTFSIKDDCNSVDWGIAANDKLLWISQSWLNEVLLYIITIFSLLENWVTIPSFTTLTSFAYY